MISMRINAFVVLFGMSDGNVPSWPSSRRKNLMYGPGSPFMAAKHNAVSSVMTGRPI